MPAKGTINADHIPKNKYALHIVPGITITVLGVSGIEEELETVVLPDRTNASGGNTKSGEFTIRTMLHHTIEQIFLEEWFKECQDPVLPLYKRQGTLVMSSISGEHFRSFSMTGLFLSKRSLPDLEMTNEGEAVEVTWTVKYDDVYPV